jgi:hypothetical protein
VCNERIKVRRSKRGPISTGAVSAQTFCDGSKNVGCKNVGCDAFAEDRVAPAPLRIAGTRSPQRLGFNQGSPPPAIEILKRHAQTYAPMTGPRQQPTQAASGRLRQLVLGVLAFVIGVSIYGF